MTPNLSKKDLLSRINNKLTKHDIRHQGLRIKRLRKLNEYFTHFVDGVIRRTCGIASAGTWMSSVWSFFVVSEWLRQARSRSWRVWLRSGYNGITCICSGIRPLWFEHQNQRVRSNFPKKRSSSAFDASAPSCPRSADDGARHGNSWCLYTVAI